MGASGTSIGRFPPALVISLHTREGRPFRRPGPGAAIHERKKDMNLNQSPSRPRALRLPAPRPRYPGETRARLTRVADHLVDLIAELTPASPVPFGRTRALDQDRKDTGGTPFAHRGDVPAWARSRKEVHHG
jgi:hypothetical protein